MLLFHNPEASMRTVFCEGVCTSRVVLVTAGSIRILGSQETIARNLHQI